MLQLNSATPRNVTPSVSTTIGGSSSGNHEMIGSAAELASVSLVDWPSILEDQKTKQRQLVAERDQRRGQLKQLEDDLLGTRCVLC